jgi:hypothetical protein
VRPFANAIAKGQKYLGRVSDIVGDSVLRYFPKMAMTSGSCTSSPRIVAFWASVRIGVFLMFLKGNELLTMGLVMV